MTGRADLIVEEAADLLEAAGHAELAQELRAEIGGSRSKPASDPPGTDR